MSELDRVVDKLSRHRDSADESARELPRRVRGEAAELETKVDEAGDEALDDYQRRRDRLDYDLTGELPNDSPEPQ